MYSTRTVEQDDRKIAGPFIDRMSGITLHRLQQITPQMVADAALEAINAELSVQ